jgi:hypothetical protein
MIIADRGFCDLWTLAEKKFYTSLAVPLIKYATGGWQAQNAYNMLNTPNVPKTCYKVVMCDKSDEIIDLHCSLMIGMANEICSMQYYNSHKMKNENEIKIEILSENQCYSLIDSIKFILNLDYDLHQ